MDKLFANTKILIFNIVRRDKLRILIWLISILLSTVIIAASLPALYPTHIERQIMAETMKNPAITFMLGPGYGLDNYNDGAMMSHFMLLFSLLAVAIMGILLTTRYTREDEEEGFIEIIRSLPVGSLSPLAASFLLLVFLFIILAVLTGLGLSILSLEGIDFQGSFLYGASLGCVGIFFTALTGFFAQITTDTRSCLVYSFAFLIIGYIVRGIGDISYEALSLLSPLGLILKTEVFVNNYWWPVLLTLGLSVFLFGISLYLNSIRDLGAGFIATKAGRPHASKFLSSPLGLALRLERTSIITWMIGLFFLGASYGSILGDLEGFIDSSDIIMMMLPQAEGYNTAESFIAMLIGILSVFNTLPVLLCVLKLKSEETKGRIENLLARALSRNRLLATYSLIGLLLAPILQLLSLVGLWSAATFVMEDVISINILIKAGLVNLPAMYIFLALAVFLIGCFPKFTGLTWLYFVYSLFVSYLGTILQLPKYLFNLSPFAHIAQVPIESIDTLPLVILTIIGLILIIGGFVGYNKRDIYS